MESRVGVFSEIDLLNLFLKAKSILKRPDER